MLHDVKDQSTGSVGFSAVEGPFSGCHVIFEVLQHRTKICPPGLASDMMISSLVGKPDFVFFGMSSFPVYRELDLTLCWGVAGVSLAASLHLGFNGSRMSWSQFRVNLHAGARLSWHGGVFPLSGVECSRSGVGYPFLGLISSQDWEVLRCLLLVLLDLDAVLLKHDSFRHLSCICSSAASQLASQSRSNGSLFCGFDTGTSILLDILACNSMFFVSLSSLWCSLISGGGGNALRPDSN